LPVDPSPAPLRSPGPIRTLESRLTARGVPGPLVQSSLVNIFGFRVEDWIHTVDSHIKYGIRLLKSSQYATVSLTGVKVRPTPQTPEAMCRCLPSPCFSRSSRGWPVSVSIAPVAVVRIAPVIPKHVSLCTLLILFLALAVCQPGRHTKDAKQMVGRTKVT